MIAALGVCGVTIVGFAFWNYQLSGKNDELLEQKRLMELEAERQESEVRRLLERNKRLIEDATKQAVQLRETQNHNNGLRDTVDLLEKNLASQIEHYKTLEAQVPKHDALGRFKKK